MDVLVAMGSSAAFFYSLPVTVSLTLGSQTLGAHVYFETAALIITAVIFLAAVTFLVWWLVAGAGFTPAMIRMVGIGGIG